MLVEQRTYTLKPGAANQFLACYESKGMIPQMRYLKTMIGYYKTEVGPLNQVIHFWLHDSFEARIENREKMRNDRDFKLYWNEVKELVVSQESKLMIPADFFKDKLRVMSENTTAGYSEIKGSTNS